jgi:hypothetical protein
MASFAETRGRCDCFPPPPGSSHTARGQGQHRFGVVGALLAHPRFEAKPVVVHVEPDLWGSLEQAGDAGLAESFAQQWVKLRDATAPNVILAYHMSGWGTKHARVATSADDDGGALQVARPLVLRAPRVAAAALTRIGPAVPAWPRAAQA